MGTDISQPQKNLPKSVALPYLVPRPCRCAAKGKASAQFLGGGDIDHDEIRLTSANQFKIDRDSGDLETRAGGARAQLYSAHG